jgi:hypothetical protein
MRHSADLLGEFDGDVRFSACSRAEEQLIGRN